jgi:hypothetical protein
MKYLLFLVLIACSCQNEKPYLVENRDTTYISYDTTLPKVDTIHDTIYKQKVNHKKKSGYVPISSWSEPITKVEVGYFDTLSGGTYSVSKIDGMADENIELNYSIDNKIQIGWNGKHWVMCGMDGWGDCSIHLYHKSLRDILDSANHK